MTPRLLILIVAAAIGCSFAAVANAQTLPYEGRLDLDGQPVNGTQTMEVVIVPAPLGSAVDACWGAPTTGDPDTDPAEAPCYTTGPFQVELVAGAFAIELGAPRAGGVAADAADDTSLADYESWVFGNEAVYLYLSVGPPDRDLADDTSPAIVPLAGAQRLVNQQRVGSAYELRDGSAEGFSVEGDLVVVGAVEAGEYRGSAERPYIVYSDDCIEDGDPSFASDCRCPTGYTAIGGMFVNGGGSFVPAALRESRQLSGSLWRISCITTAAGERIRCDSPAAVCLLSTDSGVSAP